MAQARKKNGNGVRETDPGKFVVSMYDPRARGGTKHVGTFLAPPQPQRGLNWYPTRSKARKAAEDAKRDAERARDRQLSAPKGEESIGSFCDRWARDYVERRGESTLRHNAERVKALKRDFGARPLRDGISKAEARAWVFGGIVPADIRTVAKKWHGAKTLPDGDVEVPEHTGHHQQVRALFNDAIKDDLASSNPFAALNVPEKPGRRLAQVTMLSEAELAQLVETAHEVLGDYGVHFGALIEASAWTGLRPGEMWAFDIDEKPTMNFVNLSTDEIRVDWQITRYGKRTPPKWGSRRTVFLLPPARAAFKRAIEDRPNGELWYTARGHRLSGRTAGYYWDRVRSVFWAKLPDERRSKTKASSPQGAEAGKIPVDFDFYELRHLFGTQLAEMGMTPSEIANQMGHKDGGELALRRYIHPRKESVKRSMADRYAEHQRRRAVGG